MPPAKVAVAGTSNPRRIANFVFMPFRCPYARFRCAVRQNSNILYGKKIKAAVEGGLCFEWTVLDLNQ